MIIVFRNFCRIAPALIVFALYQSCSPGFNPAAPYKNVTVVYGLLNLSDTVQYIKIEKTFLSESGGNAYTEGQIADSLYYPEGIINASLEAFNNGSMATTLPLTRVDGATIGLNKDTGIFATNPNIVYYTKAPLNAAYSYQLVINNTKTGKIITSQQIILVDSFTVISPNRQETLGFSTDPLSYINVKWFPSPNAVVYQMVIRFYYSEINSANTNDSTVKYITWTFPSFISSSNSSITTVTQNVPESDFYTLAAALIPVNTSVKRRALYLDFQIYAGGSQLYTYEQVSVASSTSLVQGTINPVYTDINNGIGLFSSTYLESVNGIGIDPLTMDSLACSSITKQLNFLNSEGQLCQ